MYVLLLSTVCTLIDGRKTGRSPVLARSMYSTFIFTQVETSQRAMELEVQYF
jgi:hypothetical protein